MQCAIFTKNISPYGADPLRRTLYELLHSKKPSIKHMHPFGIKVFVHILVEARKPSTKLLHRAEEGLFVGYSSNTKTCCVYIPSRNVVFETRDL